jgi:hypothetical protein
MSRYAVTTRIDRARVHALLVDRPDARVAMVTARASRPADSVAEVEPVAGEGRLDAFLADLRARWAQTTFYLFDPNSWR